MSPSSDTAKYTIGTEVVCRDGACGDLRRVVIDPVARALTHLVVEPKHREGIGRLVPIGIAEATAGRIRLRCSAAEFDTFEDAEETYFLPEADAQMGYGAGQVYAWPYYGLGEGYGVGMGGVGISGVGVANHPEAVIEDRVPAGEVEVRRGEHVHAVDGDIGRVQGLLIDTEHYQVTAVLLEDGHLWGKREIAIPISAVKEVAADGVRLNLTKSQIRALPAVDQSSDR